MSATTMPDIDRVAAVVAAALKDVLAQRGAPADGINPATRLLGTAAVVDSIGLVTLVVDLEERVEREFGKSVSLANERAMSQANSPFLSVGSLTDYLRRLLLEAPGNGRP